MSQTPIGPSTLLEIIHGEPAPAAIEQPFDDSRLRVGRTYIGCVDKSNADLIMAMQEQASRVRRLEAALAYIAFGPVSDLAGNPLLWPSTVAYVSLGGRFEAGARQDTLEALVPSLKGTA
jgi:hypothetical protein